MPNRLISETSPYLLQHAQNPVDWYPWGEEALNHAVKEDKPILLSIGYSACHWCHVMERESFENPEIARLMNENFISIKVDREERPDLDAIYMEAVQVITGSGGWPLTVFLTPQKRPFYGGTYFPPEERGGLPGFTRVLQTVAQAYKNRKGDVESAAEKVIAQLNRSNEAQRSVEPLTPDLLNSAHIALESAFDAHNGGFGPAPKFPQPMLLEFLLRHQLRTGNEGTLSMVERTLEKMARGGIYDQLGGGFHRYSTDARWLVPHFEKMLYDNALLSRLYLHAYQATGKPLYRHIVEGTLDYVLREMTDKEGGFYSSQDADSEGIEGKYYVWTVEEVIEALGDDVGRLVNRYFGVTEQGNFEGLNILNRVIETAALAPESGLTLETLEATIATAKARLLERRGQRVPPHRDEKILADWNGLMLSSMAEAASVLDREDYLEAAISNATFLTHALLDRGFLKHSYKDGQAKISGYLLDYALLCDGLLSLYEATFQDRWLRTSKDLA
ncbi:MAG: thioredoxin domain-containing protein, partial [Dehalococcoidia bacterium]